MDIADKIKFLRTNILNLSQDKFAKKIDVTRATINNWEQGLSTPTIAHITIIALVCNITTDYLIKHEHPLELSVRDINDEEYQILTQLINYFALFKKIVALGYLIQQKSHNDIHNTLP